MGIPRFYRWLSERYPQINQRLDENVEQLLPQFDNMYLDANGIIHNCSHPNDDLTTSAVNLSLEEMATQMCAYIDRMVQLIRPGKVLFIAIDGCAPRAKMNQQRCRRFATARDAAQAQSGMSDEERAALFDSNQITPGTQFMADLTHFFEFFFRLKIKTDPLYAKLKVVFSGNNVAGEGEHKIMDYIRNACDVETRHCLVGLDADLICLALASNMPHFSLLREAVDFQSFRKAQKQNATKEVMEQITQKKFELLRVSTLREYIALEYSKITPHANRVFDDWVLMIMLVGNDFLPPLPTMDIFEGGLDAMLEMHKEMIKESGGNGFLINAPTATTGGCEARKQINFKQLEVLFRRLGALEGKVFAEREVRLSRESRRGNGNGNGGGHKAHLPLSNVSSVVAEIEEELDSGEEDLVLEEGEENLGLTASEMSDARKRRTKYYTQKFGACDETLISEVVQRYVQGLNWVFQYYYFGVPSWNWFFPFHYSPLCSDLKNLPQEEAKFEMGQPFPPFCQLLACLPANSSRFLPKPFQDLMIKEHSPLKEFYPATWIVDENGKRNPWEFVNLLPFIDERVLFDAVAKLDLSQLSPSELARNRFGEAYVYEADLANLEEVLKSPFTVHYSQTLAPALTSKRVFRVPKSARASFAVGESKTLVSDSSLGFHPQLSKALCVLKPIKLNTFGSPSQKSTLVLRFNAFDRTIEQLASRASAVCWINYPHLNEAIIAEVVDVRQRRSYSFETKSWSAHVSNVDELKLELDRIHNQNRFGAKLPGTGGMDFGEQPSYIALRVKTLCEIREDASTGRLEKKYSAVEFIVPAETVVFDLNQEQLAEDDRFLQEAAEITLENRFPLNVSVICVGEKGYGMQGKVVGHEREEAVLVEFPKLARPGNEFARSLASALQDKYYSLTEIAKRVNLPLSIVDKFLGSLPVWHVVKQQGKPEPVDIGLNLRVGKGFVVPGYARFIGGGNNVVAAWKSGDSVVRVAGSQTEFFTDKRNAMGNLFEFSQAAIDLLVLYQSKFPQVFQRAATTKSNNGGDFQRKDLFGGAQDSTPELLLTWLRQVPSYSIPLVPISSTQMSRAAVAAIDVATREIKSSKLQQQQNDTVVVPVLPHQLRKNPQFNRGQMLSPTALITPPLLGDRVLNLTNVLIPFGLRGVIVGTHPASGAVQVVFEESFVGGSTLSGLCKVGHGALLPYIQVLNLTQRGAIALDPNAPPPTNVVLPPSKEELRRLQLAALESRQKQQQHAAVTPKKPSTGMPATTAASAKPKTPNLAWQPAAAPITVAKLKPQQASATKPPPQQQAKSKPAPSSTAKMSTAAPPSQHQKQQQKPAVVVAKPSSTVVAPPAATQSGDDVGDLANYFLGLMNASSSSAAPAPAPPPAPVAMTAPEPVAAPPLSGSAASLARMEQLFKRAQQQGANKHDTD